MKTKNTTTLRHILSSAVVAFALATSTLVAGLTFAASPAQADGSYTPPSNAYGYKKVYNQEEYFRKTPNPVLFVDTAHADADGFWYAYRVTGGRGFGWAYQPYGMWCTLSAYKVEWNGFMNRNWCVLDESNPDLVAEQPQYPTRTAACRVETGYPWKQDRMQSTQSCGDRLLDYGKFGVTTRPVMPMSEHSAQQYDCAPWEDQGLKPDGSPKCLDLTYAWASGPADTQWVPAPDSCTGMPVDSNARVVAKDPALYAPAMGGDSTCTGDAAAPNCADAPAAVAAAHQACTGVEPTGPTLPDGSTDPGTGEYSSTATVSVTKTATESVTVTRTATAKVLRWQKVVTVVKRKNGRRYVGRAYARVYVTRSRSAAVTKTVTATSTATVTRNCAAATQAEADACAETLANAAASAQAENSAAATAQSTAYNQAKSAAASTALYRARVAAKAVTVTAAMKRSAVRVATRVALRIVYSKMR